MPNPESLLANGIYRISKRFNWYLLFMILVGVLSLVSLLDFILRDLFGYVSFLAPLQTASSFASAGLSAILLISSPIVVVSVWRTWKSLTKWRKSFLRFTLVSNMEATVFEDVDPQERLVKAMVLANPDYDDILTPQLSKSGTGYPELTDLFKNASFNFKGRKVTFDVLIGVPGLSKGQLTGDKEQDSMVDSLLHSISRIGNMANILRAISEVGVSAGRIVKGPVSIDDYSDFASDLKLLAAHTRSKIIRAYLVSTELPKTDVVAFARNKGNWPRYDLHRIPIDLVVQEEVGYEVLLTN